MAVLKFDDAPEAGRAPAGPPSVPISRDNLDRSQLRAEPPSVPISQPNLDLKAKGLRFEDAPEASEAQKSVARIRDIAGKMQAGSPYTPGPIDYIADAATLSTARPISALAGAGSAKLLGSYPDASFEEIYKAGIQYMNQRAAEAERNTGPLAPVVGGLAQLPATMAMPGVRGATAPASTLKVAGQAAIPGFIEGASQHAESLPEAAKGGTVNAALSAGTSAVLNKGMEVALPAARRGAAAEAQAARGVTPEETKINAKTLYAQLDDAGIAYSPQQTAGLYTALHDMRNRGQYSEAANPTLRDHFNSLMSLTRQGASFNQLHDLRSVIAEQARGPDPSTRRAAGQMLGEIDRLTTRTVPAINPNNVDINQIYPEASRLWRAASLADDAGWIADKTARKQAWKSGVNPDETTRGNFAALEQRISKPGAYDPYTDRQRELLGRIVQGDKPQNLMSGVGGFLNRQANTLGIGAGGAASTLGLLKGFETAPSVAAALIGLPVKGAAHLAGGALEQGAATRGQGHVNALLRDITGSPKPAPGGAITRGDLAKILFAQDLERLAPRVGSQVIGTQPDRQE